MRLASPALAAAALACLAASAAVAAPALAQSPVQLAWRACSGAPGATAGETFSCNANVAPGGDPVTFRLVGSFTPSLPMADFTGIAAIVDVVTPDPVLPSWWRLGAGECREGSLNANLAYGAPGLCTNPFAPGSPLGANLAWVTGYASPNRARLYVDIVAIAPSAIAAGARYTAFDLRFDAAHAIDDGDPQCGGCCTPACVVLGEVRLFGVNGPGEVVVVSGQEAVAGWNGQAFAGTPGGCTAVGGCPTGSSGSTWGAIKSLYR